MCYASIRWARIDKIYYANTRVDADKIGFSDNEIYDEIIKNDMKLIKMDCPKALDVFKQWDDDQGHVRY